MKVVIAHSSREPKVVELPDPPGARGYINVRVSHSAMVLPDELTHIERAPEMIKKGQDGIPLGSCASGTIIDVGEGVKKLKAGLRVAVAGSPYVYHGGNLVVPENLAVELPKKVNHEEGAFAGLGARGLHLVRTGGIQLGEIVIVFGADLLGLITAQLVRAAGATAVLVDDSEFRLNKARMLGIAHAMLPDDEELIRLVDQLSAGHGVDGALLTRSGDTKSFALAAEFVREGGKIVQGASIGKNAPLDYLREKRVSLLPAVGAGAGAGDRDFEVTGAGYPRSMIRRTERDNMGCFCNLLADRKVQLSPLVTDRIPIDRAPVAYEKASRGRDSVLGVVLTY